MIIALVCALLEGESVTHPQLYITTEAGDPAVVHVVGELDLATTPLLENALDPLTDVVVDLSGVTFLGSIAIAALLAADRHRAETGHTLRLAKPSAVVTRVLSITGLDQHFGTAPNRPSLTRAGPYRNFAHT